MSWSIPRLTDHDEYIDAPLSPIQQVAMTGGWQDSVDPSSSPIQQLAASLLAASPLAASSPLEHEGNSSFNDSFSFPILRAGGPTTLRVVTRNLVSTLSVDDDDNDEAGCPPSTQPSLLSIPFPTSSMSCATQTEATSGEGSLSAGPSLSSGLESRVTLPMAATHHGSEQAPGPSEVKSPSLQPRVEVFVGSRAVAVLSETGSSNQCSGGGLTTVPSAGTTPINPSPSLNPVGDTTTREGLALESMVLAVPPMKHIEDSPRKSPNSHHSKTNKLDVTTQLSPAVEAYEKRGACHILSPDIRKLSNGKSKVIFDFGAIAGAVPHLVGPTPLGDPRAWNCGYCQETTCGQFCHACGTPGLVLQRMVNLHDTLSPSRSPRW